MPSIQDYLDGCKSLDKSTSSTNSQQQNSPTYDTLCTMCGSTVKNTQYTVCSSCLENGKEAGWFDEGW